jgi:diaminopimelate decarboxylase
MKRHKKTRGNGLRAPQKDALDQRLLAALKTRSAVLPAAVLQTYLERFWARRQIFLEGATRFGSPHYFYDQTCLVAAARRFQATFERHFGCFQAFFAVKSNCLPALVRDVVAQGLGLDVSSGLELGGALALNCPRIVFSGPGKTDSELQLALANRPRVILLLDSFGELERVTALVRNQPAGDALRCGVRVHGPVQGKWNKFGIPLDQLPRMLKAARAVKGLRFCGIQMHSSWNLTPEPQKAMIAAISACLRNKVPPDLWQSLEFLDIGGGFWPEAGEWLNSENTLKGSLLQLIDPKAALPSVHYYRPSAALEVFAQQLSQTISACGPPLCDLAIWAEPGRWICHGAMHVVLRVVDRKGPRSVITDSGTHLLGWERPLSEFIPVLNLSQPARQERSCMIFGSLCTPSDIWGKTYFGAGIAVGDILLIPDQGAYTYSLRQSFIKPLARVIQYDGQRLTEIEASQSA